MGGGRGTFRGDEEIVRRLTVIANTNRRERNYQMSDGYDGGGYEAAHVDADQEHYNLDHGASEYGADQDHSLNHQAYGVEDHHEADQHYNHGEAEHYHAPDGTDYSKVEYTNYDSHVEDHEAAYAENYNEHDSYNQYAEADYLKEHLFAEFDHANYLDSGDGHAAIAAK
jgi:hypothetical protein